MACCIESPRPNRISVTTLNMIRDQLESEDPRIVRAAQKALRTVVDLRGYDVGNGDDDS